MEELKRQAQSGTKGKPLAALAQWVTYMISQDETNTKQFAYADRRSHGNNHFKEEDSEN